jgi:AICAR transformylase/IMP cyclohydrolase PurH
VIESLKEKFRSITQIKNVRERIVSAESVTFEVDTSIPADELLPYLQKIDIGGQKLVKSSAKSEELVLSWAR